jgi:hypothetical protein
MRTYDTGGFVVWTIQIIEPTQINLERLARKFFKKSIHRKLTYILVNIPEEQLICKQNGSYLC